MSLDQLTDYLLWKSIKHETSSTSSGQKNNIKQESVEKPEILYCNMICRVCTNAAEISITEKIGDIPIISAIRKIANISITEADHYPKYVCKACLEELKIAYQFKTKCENSDMLFRKAISTDKVVGPQPNIKLDISPLLHQREQERSIENIAVKKDIEYDNVFSNQNMPRSLSIYLGQDTTISENKNKKPSRRNTKTSQSKHQNINTQNHIIKSQNKRNFKCKDDSNGIINVDKNEKKLKPLKMNKCRHCDLLFDTKEKLQKHQKVHNNTLRACPLCGKVVLNLASHESLVHTRTNKYTCHECGKVYYSSVSLSHHVRDHKETNSRGYFCDHCPYKGERKIYLINHIRTMHTRDRRYLCTMCPKKFSNLSNLRKHTLIHYNKKFECSTCKKLFRQKSSLKEHFDAIHLHIKYRCSICGKDLSSRRKLLRHELGIHKREKHKTFGEVQKVMVVNDDG